MGWGKGKRKPNSDHSSTFTLDGKLAQWKLQEINGVSWRTQLKMCSRIRRGKETKMTSEEIQYERHRRNLQI